MFVYRSRLAFVAVLTAGLFFGATHSGSAIAQPIGGVNSNISFDISAQPLSSALSEFARQSGQELFYAPEVASQRMGQPVHGQLNSEEAMSRLLQGSGLEYFITPDGGMMVGTPEAVEGYRAQVRLQQGAGMPVDIGASPATAEPDVDIARYAGIEEVIVTGQKRAERMQDVPIAISAFSMDALDQQKIEGGFDLLKAVPNVTFSKTNFSGYNFQIRGIGTQAVSATTDPGVAMSMNNTTLIVNRLFEQEYLDMERVEVLRGPQGTLYGRNATAGVINVISAKPQMGAFGGEVKLETGNYNARRFRGHVNVPLYGDSWAMRAAYASTQRDGYGTNLAAGESFIGREAPSSEQMDDRDLWTARISLGFEPNDRFRANLIWERFKEDDHRLRSAKQLCHRDPGVSNVAGLDMATIPAASQGTAQQRINSLQMQMSQGCLPGSLFDKGNPADPDDNGAYGMPHGGTIPFVRGGYGGTFNVGSYSGVPGCTTPEDRAYVVGGPGTLINPCMYDPMAGGAQSHDLRTIYSSIEPVYRASSELLELSMDFQLTDGVTISSQTVYMENEMFSTQDFLRFETLPGLFTDTNAACSGSFDPDAVCENPTSGHGGLASVNLYFRNVMPGGVYDDPQLGPSDRLLIQDVSQQVARQFNQELRFTSDFTGPMNFNIGLNYTRFENTADYFVFSNMLSALADAGMFARDPSFGGSSATAFCGEYHTVTDFKGLPRADCVYIQPESLEDTVLNPEGHNFFLSRNPFSLNSASVFGEVYYEVTDRIKLTAGARFNWDRKKIIPVPSQTMLQDYRNFTFLSLQDISTTCDVEASNVLTAAACSITGNAPNGRGYPSLAPVVQEWRVPTGRIGIDWKPDVGVDWVDETLVYAFYTRGYKAGGANPPLQAPPSGMRLAMAQHAVAPPLFEAEYVNAFELGTKNTLLGNALTLSASAFWYDYSDYQVSKIIDRSAQNENFDATIWGLELESLFAPAENLLLNASIGYLRTRIDDGQRSLDLMDRTQGGHQVFQSGMPNPNYGDPTGSGLGADQPENEFLVFDEWTVLKPTYIQASNCVAPSVLVRHIIEEGDAFGSDTLARFCPARDLGGVSYLGWDPIRDAPNGGAGFFADIGGNELPNAPRVTVSLGAQWTRYLSQDWAVTSRLDWYWQDESFHRVYNTEYDQLKAWTNTNMSVWLGNERHGLTVEVYVKNVFNETPVTGAFLNSDDTGLSTNVFTLDPRLVGVSIRKRF